ncbi:Hypothetical_protein [Hexamita inflata]|uniref:Hypothetical_protein n=1 Tax=Hexamita inflata TaxID=28002 RepID=A0AA86UM00_9EUKA|nr:Hypothetical protein HINF_LOCUS32043 [Hexamita inflata]
MYGQITNQVQRVKQQKAPKQNKIQNNADQYPLLFSFETEEEFFNELELRTGLPRSKLIKGKHQIVKLKTGEQKIQVFAIPEHRDLIIRQFKGEVRAKDLEVEEANNQQDQTLIKQTQDTLLQFNFTTAAQFISDLETKTGLRHSQLMREKYKIVIINGRQKLQFSPVAQYKEIILNAFAGQVEEIQSTKQSEEIWVIYINLNDIDGQYLVNEIQKRVAQNVEVRNHINYIAIKCKFYQLQSVKSLLDMCDLKLYYTESRLE